MTQWTSLGLALVGTAVAAFIGAAGSVDSATFYRQLARPAWAPPAALFGPVWTTLYLMMAVAAWLVVRAQGWARARPAIALYALQLALNALWTWLFFRWHLGAVAMIEILVLWVLVLLTAWLFWRARRLAGLLLLPYLAWVGFAAALTYAVWRRNPGLL